MLRLDVVDEHAILSNYEHRPTASQGRRSSFAWYSRSDNSMLRLDVVGRKQGSGRKKGAEKGGRTICLYTHLFYSLENSSDPFSGTCFVIAERDRRALRGFVREAYLAKQSRQPRNAVLYSLAVFARHRRISGRKKGSELFGCTHIYSIRWKTVLTPFPVRSVTLAGRIAVHSIPMARL